MLSLTEMASYEKQGKLFEGVGRKSIVFTIICKQFGCHRRQTSTVQLYRFPVCLSIVRDMELTETCLNDYMTRDLACGQDPQFVM